MKIHIIGGSGSGKTYLARLLSEKYNIPHYDLDDLFWDNTSGQYGTKNPPEKRDAMLKSILQNEDWIIEGAYYAWLADSFEQADTIIVLDMPQMLYKSRIIRRFVKRKLGLCEGKKETVKSLLDLLKWTEKFQTVNLKEIYKILDQYSNKTVILKSKREVNNYYRCEINGRNPICAVNR